MCYRTIFSLKLALNYNLSNLHTDQGCVELFRQFSVLKRDLSAIILLKFLFIYFVAHTLLSD